MKNFFCLILVIIPLISACSSQGPQKQGEQTRQVSVIKEKPALSLETVDFTSDLEVRKVKLECSMLEKLSLSILDSSSKYKANIKRAELTSQKDEGQYILRATYTVVIPPRWRFPSVRPSSTATVKAQILKDGEVIKSTSKAISSTVAFGACDRLEKIAIAGGRYISKWASIQEYN